MQLTFHFNTWRVIVLVVLLLPQLVMAGLLEIPEITHSVPLKGKSVFENMDVPPLRDRDPNPESGPRIWVKKIKVQGVVDRPDYDISVDGVTQFVENLRKLAMREDELLKYGFSLEELAEIADLMLEIDALNNLEQVTEPDVQKLVWLVREQKERRGLSLGQIENIAEQLTNYYRKRGFFLTKVYIPSQEVRDGVIGFTVLEGMLGDVSITGNDRYNTDFLIKTFNDLKYQPVNERDIEQKLYLLNDYPGLEMYGYFKAGDQIGDTRLNLQVRRETPWDATARLDNHGSDLTGKQRLYAQVDWFNPSKIADQLTLGLLQTVEPDNSTYGIFKYRAPLFSEEYHAGVNISRNQFVIGDGRKDGDIGFLGLTGETQMLELVFDYAINRTRENNWGLSLHIANKESDMDSEVISTITDEEVQVYKLQTEYDVLNEQSRVLNQFVFSYSNGDSTLKQIDSDVERSFSKFNLRYSFLSFAKIPWIDSSIRVVFKSDMQYTDDVLPNIEQSTIGGPHSVRAFSITEFPADKSIYAGMDVIFNWPAFMDFRVYRGIPFSRVVNPVIFVDYAYGVLNPVIDLVDEITGELSGTGIGLQVNYKNKISGNLQYARSLGSHFSSDQQQEPEDDDKIVVEFQYKFD